MFQDTLFPNIYLASYLSAKYTKYNVVFCADPHSSYRRPDDRDRDNLGNIRHYFLLNIPAGPRVLERGMSKKIL
jgi:hypothetical protein